MGKDGYYSKITLNVVEYGITRLNYPNTDTNGYRFWLAVLNLFLYNLPFLKLVFNLFLFYKCDNVLIILRTGSQNIVPCFYVGRWSKSQDKQCHQHRGHQPNKQEQEKRTICFPQGKLQDHYVSQKHLIQKLSCPGLVPEYNPIQAISKCYLCWWVDAPGAQYNFRCWQNSRKDHVIYSTKWKRRGGRRKERRREREGGRKGTKRKIHTISHL